MRQAVALAAKAPQPGTVKTRLIPDLSPEEAAELYSCFLRDALELIESVPGIDIFISYQQVAAEAQIRRLLGDRHTMLAQRGEDLGERIYNTLADLLGSGYESAFVIGSDLPNLPRDYIEMALDALRPAGNRIVLGPSSDGGYYLIGVKELHRRLFEDITWSSEQVLRQTIQRARELQVDFSLLPEWYDVDTRADLERLIADLTLPGSASSSRDTNGRPCNTRQYLTASHRRLAG